MLLCYFLGCICLLCFFFFFQAEDGIRDSSVTGVQTCALPIWACPLRVGGRVGGDNRTFPPPRALTPVPSPVRPPTRPPRTGEGRHRPTPKTTEKLAGCCFFWAGAPSPARGGGRWHARGRVGEGADGGKARSS